jgi:hypothetical protein
MTVLQLVGLGFVLTGCSGNEGVDDSGPDRGDTADDPYVHCSDGMAWYEGDLYLSEQSDLDQVCLEFNGIQGDLEVYLGSAADPVNELDGISCLCQVTGDVDIYWMVTDAADTGGEATDTGAGGGDDDTGKPAGSSSPPPVEPSSVPPPHRSGEIELIELVEVGGDLRIHDIPGVTGVTRMELLETVGGDLVLDGLPQLVEINLSGLTSVAGVLRWKGLEILETVELPGLTALGGIELGERGEDTLLGELETFSIPQVSSVPGDLALLGTPLLASLDLSALELVGGGLRIEGMCALDPSLGALASVGSLWVAAQCSGSPLDALGSLTTVSSETAEIAVGISHLDELTEAQAEAFVEALAIPDGATTTIDLDEGCEEAWVDWYSTHQEYVCP